RGSRASLRKRFPPSFRSLEHLAYLLPLRRASSSIGGWSGTRSCAACAPLLARKEAGLKPKMKLGILLKQNPSKSLAKPWTLFVLILNYFLFLRMGKMRLWKVLCAFVL